MGNTLVPSSNVHVACVQLHVWRSTTESLLNLLVFKEQNIYVKKEQEVKENSGLSTFVSPVLFSLVFKTL